MGEKKMLLVGSSARGALEYSYKKAAEVLGWETKLFDPAVEEVKYIKGGRFGRKLNQFLPVEPWIRKMNREIVLLCRDYSPEFLFIFTNVNILPGTLACIKTMMPAIKIVWIWPDPPLSLEKHNLFNGALVDMTATYSSATIPVFQQLGFKNVQWVPLAGDLYMHGNKPTADQQFDCHISFAGTWRPERGRVMTAICEHFKDLNIEIHGRYWKRDTNNSFVRKRIKSEGLFEADLKKLYARSYININVIDDTNFPAANMRFFEIPAAGGLQVTSMTPEMEGMFRQHEEAIYYKNEHDVVTQVQWALDNASACSSIRLKAHELVTQQHTYTERLRGILAQL